MKTLSWIDLAPPLKVHSCDCGYCDMDGEFEPVEWPMLVRLTHDGLNYITDRYLVILEDLAPIPESYPGTVQAEPTRISENVAAFGRATSETPFVEFRRSTSKALELMGWTVRTIEGSRLCAVLNADLEQIGWASPLPRNRDGLGDPE